MDDIKGKWSRLAGSPFLLAVSVSLFLFLAGHPQYETNDDLSMIGILAGKTGLQPVPDAVFLSLPLSWILFVLYRLSDSIPWYGLILYSFLFAALYLGVKTILFFSLRGITKALLVSALAFLYGFTFYRFNFTGVALFMWFAALSYLGALNLYGQLHIRSAWLMGAFTGAAYLVRPDLAYLAVVVACPMLATFLVPAGRRRALYVAAPLTVIALTAVIGGYFHRNNDEYRRYARFNSIRSEFSDTAKSSATALTPAALARAQWSPEDYLLGKRLWLHDERIYSSERIATFLSSNAEAGSSIVSTRYFVSSFTRYWTILLVLGLSVLALALESPGHVPAPETKTVPLRALCGLFLLLSVVAVVALAGIRFPNRVALPVFGSFLLQAVVLRPLTEKPLVQQRSVKRVFYACAFSLLFYLAWANWNEMEQVHVGMMGQKARSDQSFQLARLANGPDTVFVYADATHYFSPEAVSPFREYRDVQDVAILPMGWLIGSPAYNAFLKRYGFGERKSVVPQIVDKPQVLLCFFQQRTGSFNSYASQLMRHLELNYAHLFPGRQLKLAAVLDLRDLNTGWIFFRVVSVPTPLASATAAHAP